MSKETQKHYANLLLESVDSKLKTDDFLTRAILRYVCSVPDDYNFGKQPCGSTHMDVVSENLNVSREDLDKAVKFLDEQKLVATHTLVPSRWLGYTEAGKIYSKARLNREFGFYSFSLENINKAEFQNIMSNLNRNFEITYNKTFNVDSDELIEMISKVKDKLNDVISFEQNSISDIVDNRFAKKFKLSAVEFKDYTENNLIPSLQISAIMDYTTLEKALSDGPNTITGNLRDTNQNFKEIDKGYFPVKFVIHNFGNDSFSMDVKTSLGPKSYVWQQNLDYQKAAIRACKEAAAPLLLFVR